MTLKTIAQEALIQKAYEHVKNRRKNSHANADIWHTATHWHAIKKEIIAKLNTGTYQLDLVKNHILKNKRMVAYWRSPDAIVLKAIAITLTAKINKQSHMQRVKHLKGNGGIKAAVREAYELSQNPQTLCIQNRCKKLLSNHQPQSTPQPTKNLHPRPRPPIPHKKLLRARKRNKRHLPPRKRNQHTPRMLTSPSIRSHIPRNHRKRNPKKRYP